MTNTNPSPRPPGPLESSLTEGSDLDTVDLLLSALAKSIDDGAAPRDLGTLTRRMSELLAIRAALRAQEEANKPKAAIPGRPAIVLPPEEDPNNYGEDAA